MIGKAQEFVQHPEIRKQADITVIVISKHSRFSYLFGARRSKTNPTMLWVLTKIIEDIVKLSKRDLHTTIST